MSWFLRVLKPSYSSQRLTYTKGLNRIHTAQNLHTSSICAMAETTITPQASANSNPVDFYRTQLTELLAPVTGVDPKIIYPALEWTASQEKGDLIMAIPRLRVKGKPADLAAEWSSKFPKSDLFQPPVVSGPFLQFFFAPAPLSKAVLPLILSLKTDYGKNPKDGLVDPEDPSKGKKKIIVEFSSPNIAKPFHAGHLRSTIIGGFLSNLYDGAGWKVIRINYLGDWGRQFGLLAVAFKKFGSEEKLLENPIGHLYDIYVEINKHSGPEEDEIKAKKEKGEDTTELEENSLNTQARAYFRRMEDGDEDALGIWRRFRDLSIVRYKQTYARLNIHFDDYSGESQIKQESMNSAATILKEKGVSEESDGAVIVNLTKFPAGKKLGKAVVQKKDGTTLYLTRDISAAAERYEKYHFDKMIYVIASQQDLHVAQLFKILEVMGKPELAARCQHINFGMVLGMSTRRGTVKFLDDILRDVGEKMHEVMRANEVKYAQVENPDQVADILGITSVMVQDMKAKRFVPTPH
jgi:arginyl-tRNA synthetase